MFDRVERRQNLREEVRISGTAVADDGLLRVPVSIVNLSRSGVMVEVESDDLPDELVLLFNNSAEPCRKIWHEGQRAGFLFTAQ